MKAVWDLVTTPMPLPVIHRVVIAYALGWYWANAHQEDPNDNNKQSSILVPVGETFPENKKRRNGFEHSRHAVPHAVHVQDVRLFETDDREVNDPDVSSETTKKVAQLVAACEELQMKVTKYFGDRKEE
jgi:hypothetical protein